MMTKPTGRPRGRPPRATKPFESDVDAHVIAIADAIIALMPRTKRARAVRLSVLLHYHRLIKGAPDLLGMPDRFKTLKADGWHLVQFEKAPVSKSADDTPEGGEGFLRSETRRILEKERRLSADPAFQRWRAWAVMAAVQLALDPVGSRRVRSPA